MTFKGQMRQISDLQIKRAVIMYRKLGETRPLQVETLRLIQRKTDEAYAEAVKLYEIGKLPVRFSREEAIGTFVDRQVRNALRKFYDYNGIPLDGRSVVRVNAREYITSESGRLYRRPDARIGRVAFDVTLSRKTLSTPQVRGFFDADFQPEHVIIVRPADSGRESVYAIVSPRK